MKYAVSKKPSRKKNDPKRGAVMTPEKNQVAGTGDHKGKQIVSSDLSNYNPDVPLDQANCQTTSTFPVSTNFCIDSFISLGFNSRGVVPVVLK